MELLLYWAAVGLLGLLRRLPLRTVARLGRWGGGVTYVFDRRHRRVAIANLRRCFSAEMSDAAIRRLARENFRRIGENFACAVKTASLDSAQLREVLEVRGLERLHAAAADKPPAHGYVMAIGHFGNFELYARANEFWPGTQFISTYRALRQPRLNELMQDLREQSHTRFFERRSEAAELKAAMREPGVVLGLMADQHAGDHGLRVPFLGHECSASAAPAVFALRYECPLFVAVCYRLDGPRWRIELSDEIPLHEQGQRRPLEAITADIHRVFEAAIRRDPANWFWVHNRWKPARGRSRASSEHAL